MLDPQALIAGKPEVLAIDPGLSGAVCRMGNGAIEVRRDFRQLKDIATATRELLSPGPVDHVVIEMVSSRPGQGVVSTFSFGKATGCAFGAIFALRGGGSLVEVHPLTWQNFFRKLYGPARPAVFDSRALALRLLPQCEKYLGRKKDHNSADSILLGLYRLAMA